MEVLVGTAVGLVEAGSGRPVAFQGRDVVALADGWAVLDGQEVARADGDASHRLDGPRITCMAAGGPVEPLVGTAEAHLFRLGPPLRRVGSFDEADGRDQWYTPWGGPPDVRSVSIASTGTLLANVHVGGILRSVDDGASWQPTIDIHHDVHQVLGLDGGVALAACAHGLATSSDDGTTWVVHDDGLHATYSRAVALSGGTVLLSASSGPGGGHAALYRRPLGDAGPLERCWAGLPEWLEGNVDTFWLLGTPDGSAAFATRSGEVYVSADEGLTWERAGSGLPPVRCVVAR